MTRFHNPSSTATTPPDTSRATTTSRLLRHSAAALALIAPFSVLGIASAASAHESRHHPQSVTIYTETNGSSRNEVLEYRETAGTTSYVASYSTGGLGSGDGLGSQSAITQSDGRLLAVNAGSNQLSLFSVRDNGDLVLTDVESTGGTRPVSVTVSDDVAYVLNTGDRTVSGFRIRRNRLEAIPGSHQALPGSGGAQIAFDRYAERLVVTEKATSTIDVLPVKRGVAGLAVSNASTGITPFGFAIDDRNHVIVSNAAGGAPSAASVSSYRFNGDATLVPVSPAVSDTQTAACWVALSSDGRFAFTTNTGSGSISSYATRWDGSISLAQGVAATPGAGPAEMAVRDSELFALNGGAHTITRQVVGADGSLTTTGGVSVPTGVVGLAAI